MRKLFLLPALLALSLALGAGLPPERALAQAAEQAGKQPDLSAADTSAAEEAFKAGIAFQEQKLYDKALAEYHKAGTLLPDDPSILWYTGMCAYLVKDYPQAHKAWSRLKTLNPTDDAVCAKLIQVYQAQGNTKARAAERAELVTLRKSKKNPKLTEKPSFCCDQFVAAGRDVFAYDFFALTGKYALRYNFLILKPDGTVDYRISLGSYEFDNELARELGEIKAGQRLYHLDGYYDQGNTHRTFRFYNSEPTYDAAKKDVLAVLNGSIKEMSSTHKK